MIPLRLGFRFVMIVAALCAGTGAPAAPTTSPSSVVIDWDAKSLRLVEARAEYARMARLRDNRIACVFDRDGKTWIKFSDDDAAAWASPILVAAEPDSRLTNADLLPLKNGRLLYFWDDRPVDVLRYANRQAPEGSLKKPFRIRMSASDDLGQSWSAAQTIYSGGVDFHDGCWEPAAIELPDEAIQVYFANESPYRQSDEQEISISRSNDGGKSWSNVEQVSFCAGHRDGMPSPLLLAGNRGVVVAIEDNGISGDRFKPAIVRRSVGESSQRWAALDSPLPEHSYGGAPVLRQLESGETLLSYQESADGSLATTRMAVTIGTPDARHFGNKTYPMPSEVAAGQLWNSLFVKNASHVIAISTATARGTGGIWAIDGRIVHRNLSENPNQEQAK